MTNNQTTITYDDLIQALTAEFLTLKAKGTDITAAMCVAGLDPKQNNKNMRTFASDTLKIDEKDFDRELRKIAIAAELGMYPNTAAEYIKAVADKRQTKIKYNGEISEPGEPNVRLDILLTQMRATAIELGLGFKRWDINDAFTLWNAQARKDRLPILQAAIKYDHEVVDDGLRALIRIAETCFDDPIELVVAAILKFMQQIKQKMHGLTVPNHLMIVLLGEQGGGKSTLAKLLFSIIAEAAISANFGDMANDKIIDLWGNYVMFVDEMAKASRTDIAIIKNVITADTVSRRPMTTNAFIAVQQNLTFIGTANATEFQELIRDHTGTRRFLGLKCKPKLDWDVVNNTDWRTIWQSVDEHAIDPMTPYQDILKEKQEEQREKTRVEEWLDQLNMRDAFGDIDAGHRFSAAELHDKFREFEDRAFPNHYKTERPAFGRQLTATKDAPFSRAPKNGFWLYIGEPIFKSTNIRKIR